MWRKLPDFRADVSGCHGFLGPKSGSSQLVLRMALIQGFMEVVSITAIDSTTFFRLSGPRPQASFEAICRVFLNPWFEGGLRNPRFAP